ncbi:MAG: Asp23/Gls24 family envelope stress response protein [Chloroflexota bacterium]
MDDRQIGRIVRAAARSVYGVAAVEGEGILARLGGLVGVAGGVSVSDAGRLAVSVNIRVAPKVPAAQVATNVADAVRYQVQRDTGRTIEDLTVTVEGILLPPPAPPPASLMPPPLPPSEGGV